MDTVWVILKFIGANILLVMISSTLIGFIIRGIIQPRLKPTHGLHKAEWYTVGSIKGLILSLGAIAVCVFLLYKLYYNANLYLALGVILLMLGRVKDLVLEIRTGVKTTIKNATKGSLDFVLLAMTWIGFAVFNYGLYVYLIK